MDAVVELVRASVVKGRRRDFGTPVHEGGKHQTNSIPNHHNTDGWSGMASYISLIKVLRPSSRFD